MLTTLMKYEMKAVGRILLPLYGAWIITAVMLGLSLGGSAYSENDFFIALSAILYGVVSVAAVIMTLIILIQRFYKNLLGSEGYLMFALPVSTGKHITSKVISAAVWTIIGTLVAIITGMAIVITIEGVTSFWDGLVFIAGDIKIAIEREPSSLILLAEVLVLAVIAAAEAATKIYAAIAVGHLWSNHRVLGAFGAYIGFGIVESVAVNIFRMIVDTGIFDRIFSDMHYMTQFHLTLIGCILLAAFIAAVYWFVCWIILDRKLNLE